MSWNYFNKDYFLNLGYPEMKNGEKFLIPYYHLSQGSQYKIKVTCDEIYCTNINEVNYYDYCRLHKDFYSCKYHSQSYYQLKAKEMGFKLLSEYVDSKTSLDLICLKCGSYQTKKWSQLLKKSCKICSDNNRRLTIEHIIFEFQKVGYQLETKIYENYKNQKLYFFCDKGHYTYIKWNDFQQGCRCSECAKNRMIGENSPRWNSDLTDEERLYKRNSYEYNLWRMSVFYRDNYSCRCCGDSKGGNLIAHHIDNFSENKDLRLELDNGVTLCKECHEEFHWTYGYKNNDLSQLTEFVEDFWSELNQ